MFKKILTLILFVSCICGLLHFLKTSPKNQSSAIRAAIDIGSGATKLKVAKVNTQTKKIETVLANESFAVQYQEGLEKSVDGSFDEELMNIGIAALQKSKAIAQKYQAEKVIAVATASFRKASNVQQFIDRIYRETGIEVHIIDQKLEGILGFEATTSQIAADPKDMVIWDIGGGSFQLTALDDEGEIVVYRGVDASIPFKNRVIQHIKKQDPNTTTTPNPLNHHELLAAENHAHQISEKIDRLFKTKIANPETKVIGIGNIFAYGIYPLIGKKNSFTHNELVEKVHRLAGKTDHELGGGDYVNVSVTNPIFVMGFMKNLGIKQMDIADINNADGALVYTKFWDQTG